MKGTDIGIGLFELAGQQEGGRIFVESTSSVSGPSWPNGCHVCEVEVTPETGEVSVVRYASVNDVGRVINPMIVVGQLDGGALQGNGQAQFAIGALYAAGDSLPKDESKAVAWYEKSAKQGVVDAQFNLGVMYAAGRGVTPDARNTSSKLPAASNVASARVLRCTCTPVTSSLRLKYLSIS